MAQAHTGLSRYRYIDVGQQASDRSGTRHFDQEFSMDTQISPEDVRRQEQIQAAYDRLGLGTPAARAPFLIPPTAQQVHFEVVISTTSQPFNR